MTDFDKALLVVALLAIFMTICHYFLF